MPSQHRLKPFERQEILGAVKLRVPLKDISNRLNISYSTVKYIKQLAERQDQEQHDLPRSRRPHKSIKAQDKRLIRRTYINTSLL